MNKIQSCLVLWGGTDINSRLYDEPSLKFADTPDKKRDAIEWDLLIKATRSKTPIIGICRGAQMICAFAGGKLYQHSTGHNRSHDVIVKDLHDESKNTTITNAAAGHHQIMRLDNTNHIIYGFANEPTRVWTSDTEREEITMQPEIVYFPDINALAIQPHPEWMNLDHPFNVYINELIFKLLGVKNALS